MARFLVISINYAPEPTGFSPHVKALADHLAARGHSVTVCTGFPFAPRWRRWDEYRGRWISRAAPPGGPAVIRVTHFIPRTPGSAVQRMAMEATFCLSATCALFGEIVVRRRRPDTVLYVGAQPAIAMLARLVAACVRAPYFVNINDIATLAAVDVGIVRQSWFARMLNRFEFAAYAGAAGASVLCSRFAELLVEHGYPADRIRVIRSPIDTESIRPITGGSDFRTRHGLPGDAFVVLFAGSMGLKQGLSNVVDAAQRVNGAGATANRRVYWVLVGDGETRRDIVAQIAKRKMEAIVLVLDFQPEQELSAMFSAADVLLLNQVTAVKDSVIPSKLLTYMSAGRPVVAAVNRSSQGAEILAEADGGLIVAPEDPDALARAVERLAGAPPQDLAAMGARNRTFAEAHFDQRRILAAHETFMAHGTVA